MFALAERVHSVYERVTHVRTHFRPDNSRSNHKANFFWLITSSRILWWKRVPRNWNQRLEHRIFIRDTKENTQDFIGVFYIYNVSDEDCESVNFDHLDSFSVKQVETGLLLSSVSSFLSEMTTKNFRCKALNFARCSIKKFLLHSVVKCRNTRSCKWL